MKSSLGTNHSRGTIILIRNGSDVVIEDEQIDPDGRYILLKTKVNEEDFIFLNIYAPNQELLQIEFFSNYKKLIRKT